MNTRFIENVLYDFKKSYGDTVRYIAINKSDNDYSTGKRNIDRSVYELNSIILPQTMIRKFIQDIGYLAADKNFTYGGLNDYNSFTIVVLGKDFPDGLKLDLDGYCIYKNERYTKINIVRMADGVAYSFILKKIQGDLPCDIIPLSVTDDLVFQEDITNALN